MTIDANGRVSWIPDSARNVPITITVTDGSGNAMTQSFTLAVIERAVEKVPPTITSTPTGPAYVGEEWVYQLAATASDGSVVTFWLMKPDGSKDSVIANGKLTWTPDTEGARTYTVRAESTNGAWIEQQFTIQAVARVVVTNDPPVVRSMPTEQVRIGNSYKYKIVAFDPNGDALTYSFGQSPQGATISTEGVLSWNPSTLGQYESTILVSDGVNDPVAQTFIVNVLPPMTINTPPEITSVPLGSAMKDRTYQYQATAHDADGHPISWFIDTMSIPESVRGDLKIDMETGLVTWTPRVAGEFTFKITAFDGYDHVDQIITLPVAANAPPVIESIPKTTGKVGEEYSSKVVAGDPNGDTLAFELKGAPEWYKINAQTGEIFCDGSKLVAGTYTITVVVTDSYGATATRQFELRVTDPSVTNKAPTLTSTIPGSVPVNKPFTYQLTATDPENDPITFKLVGDVPAGMTMTSGGRIEWTPTATGTVEFQVQLSDGTNTIVYTYSTNVVVQRTNAAPTFTSTPPTSVQAGKTMTFKPTTSDPDGDAVTITIVSAPTGMGFNEKGELVWLPNSALAGKTVSLTLRATDTYGASVEKTFEIAVRSVILAPNIDMTKPLPTGLIGEKMSYQIVASDPQGEKLTYILEGMVRYDSYPTNPVAIGVGDASIDANGRLTYTPTVEGIVGFRIRVVNESGVSTPVVVFPMMVVNQTVPDPGNPEGPGKVNHAPNMNLYGGGYVEAGKEWKLKVDATDPDGDALTYTLTSYPAGMSINQQTGEISWTPTTGHINQQVKVGISVSDGNLTVSGYFYLVVTPQNNLPAIQTIGNQTATAGAKFQFDVKATDKDYDKLTYTLDAESVKRGMTINANGQIVWTPTIAQISAVPYSVTVSVSDGRGELVTTTFNITVVADTIAPNVVLTATPQKTQAGSNITLSVTATDNVGVAGRTLMLVSITKTDGTVVPVNKQITLDANGRATYTLAANEYGTLQFSATATDSQGNVSNVATTVVIATNPADTTAPTVSITSPSKNSKINGPVDIVGTVKDDMEGVRWTLVAVALDNGKVTEISSGTGNIEKGVFGRFDTTMLRNGTYQLVLHAIDTGGHERETYFNVEVAGEYKLGNFTMSFTDFDVMLSGLGITVTRTYDTLNADKKGDFGYGWTLDVATTSISVDYGDGSGAQTGFRRGEPIKDGTHITITLPDGTKEGFTFQAECTQYLFGHAIGDWIPKFIPDIGTKSELIIQNHYLRPAGNGTYVNFDMTDNEVMYTPASDGFLTLKLRNGTELVIDTSNGELLEAADAYGNKLVFSDYGIKHSSGKGVIFERDNQGRITSITGPDGKKFTYAYDSKGDLVSVTDKSNATVEFTYLSGVNDPGHYLDKVIDPLGRSASKTEYDEQGRMWRVTDADGKTTVYEFDTDSRIQKVIDQRGNTTIIENDAQGNVIRMVSPEGTVMLWTYDSAGHKLSETLVVDNNGQELHLTINFTYDSEGNMLTSTDVRGNVTRYTYNKYGQVASTTRDGVTTYTNFNGETGLPVSMTDANGRTTYYSYDSKGNPTSFRNDAGETILSSVYNKYGEVTQITLANGRTVFLEYDNNGDCVKSWFVEDGKKVLTITSRDDSRRIIGQVYYVLPNGVLPIGKSMEDYKLWETLTAYNAAGQVIKEVDRYGNETHAMYDVRGQLTEMRIKSKDTDGQFTWTIKQSVYDATGNQVAMTSYEEGYPATSIKGQLKEFDRDGRIVKEQTVQGIIIEIDAYGNSHVKSTGKILDSVLFEYSNAGWVVSTVNQYGLKTEYTYNSFGEQTKIRHQLPSGAWEASENVYDNKGRLVFTSDWHVEDENTSIHGNEFTYDTKGRCIKTTRYVGCAISIAPDGTSSLISRGIALFSTSTEYDSKGHVQRTVDALGRATTFKYDSHDREIEAIHDDGVREVTIYDSMSRVKEIRIIAGNEVRSTLYEYDIHGNVTKTILADGSVISATYNEKGQKTSETNQLGLTRKFTYDINGRLASVELPGSYLYSYEYDALGNQTLIRDPNNHETRFAYDKSGKLISRTLPLGFGADGVHGTSDDSAATKSDGTRDHSEYYVYDNFGRVSRHTSFEGIVTTFAYDRFGRLTTKTSYKDQSAYLSGHSSDRWSYEYNDFGQVTKVVQNGRETITTYDYEGKIKSVRSPEGTISYEYDKFGRQIMVTLDSGESTEYAYDRLGRLSSVTSGADKTTYEYDTFGNLAKTKYSNGNVTTYEYDNMNRLVKMSNFVDANNNGVLDDGEGISRFTYTLDALGRKASAIEQFWADYDNDGAIDLLTNKVNWKYDNAGRLIEEFFDHYDDNFDQTTQWQYDAVGNRLRQTVDKGNNGTIDSVTTYSYDANDRLLAERFDGQNDGTFEKTTEYGYDHTQQISKRVTENGTLVSETAYEYDAMGRMHKVTITTGDKVEVSTYGYGGDGIRVSALHEVYENGVLKSKTLTEYLNDPVSITGYSQVLKQTETDITTGEEKTTTYVIGHQRISQTVEKNHAKETHYYTFDGHGSTRALIDMASAVLQLYSFDAYGNALGFNPGDALTEFLYSGEQFDAKIGMQYLRERYYDPATGRFNRLDPFFGNISDPQSLHKYTYVHGDPINMVDPSGMFGVAGVSISISVGQVMNGMSGLASMTARQFACGTLSGAVVGSIMGAIAEALKYADLAANGENIDSTDMSLSIVIGALEGTVEGMKTGGWEAVKDMYTLNLAGKYQTITTLNQTLSEMLTQYSEGNYFTATYMGVMTLVELGFGERLNSMFCFVEDTLVMMEGEEAEAAAAAIAKEIAETTASNPNGKIIAATLSLTVACWYAQKRRMRNALNKKNDLGFRQFFPELIDV